jgi:hypothetical protein
VRANHRDSPRRAPRPTRAPTPLTLDFITREKKKTGEKVMRRARTGRPPPPPPAAAAAACISCIGAPHQGLARHLNNIIVSAALPPQRCRLNRRASQPLRHRASHLAVVARLPSLSRAAPSTLPDNPCHPSFSSPSFPAQQTTVQVLGGYRRRVTYHDHKDSRIPGKKLRGEPLVVGG